MAKVEKLTVWLKEGERPSTFCQVSIKVRQQHCCRRLVVKRQFKVRTQVMTFKLTDLPVEPDHDEMTCSYISQVKQVDSVDALKAHVSKWKAIWNLDVPKWLRATKEELALTDGTFDAEAAFNCLKKCHGPDGHCGHTTPSCYGMHLAVPPVLLFAQLIGNKYGVPTDVAVIQMCGGYGALYGEKK